MIKSSFNCEFAIFVGVILVLISGGLHESHADATITVINLDSPGEGFNSFAAPESRSTAGGNTGETLGKQRLIAFQYAADIWGNILYSNVGIKVGANFNPLTCGPTSAILGSAGPNSVHRNFIGAPASNTWYVQALANSLSGTDLSPDYDINAEFNSAIGTTCSFPRVWYYGLDGKPPGDSIDFVSVVLHELTHGLGFLTFVNLANGNKLLGYNDAFMFHLENHSTGKLYPEMTDGERVAASTDTGDLHWTGSSVVVAGTTLSTGRHPSGHVEMYAPAYQQAGSSVSHFSSSLFPNQLMEPSYTGPTHDLELTMALLKDTGWRLNSTCSLPNGHVDYCKDPNCGPCDVGEGDCDSDNECQNGLVCSMDVGANYGMPANYDVCEQPAGSCDVFQPGPDWCRDCGPCAEGEGDCDSDNECQNGLICAQDVGVKYGMASEAGMYVSNRLEAATCFNLVRIGVATVVPARKVKGTVIVTTSAKTG